MSNETEQRITKSIDPADMQIVIDAFQTINDTLSMLIVLSAEERIRLPKIHFDNKVFTEEAITAARANSDMLPGYLKVQDMETDLTLFNQLTELAMYANQISEKINDTRMLAGSEAYVSALTVYRLFGASSIAKVPGAEPIYEMLKERFKKHTNNEKHQDV